MYVALERARPGEGGRGARTARGEAATRPSGERVASLQAADAVAGRSEGAAIQKGKRSKKGDEPEEATNGATATAAASLSPPAATASGQPLRAGYQKRKPRSSGRATPRDETSHHAACGHVAVGHVVEKKADRPLTPTPLYDILRSYCAETKGLAAQAEEANRDISALAEQVHHLVALLLEAGDLSKAAQYREKGSDRDLRR